MYKLGMILFFICLLSCNEGVDKGRYQQKFYRATGVEIDIEKVSVLNTDYSFAIGDEIESFELEVDSTEFKRVVSRLERYEIEYQNDTLFQVRINESVHLILKPYLYRIKYVGVDL